MALVSQAELEARLKRSLTTEEASAFPLINAAIQAYVERIIGSSVEAVSATTRYYDGGLQHTVIDPVTDVISVNQVDDDDTSIYTYDTSDYALDPRKNTIKTMLRHRNGPLMRGINNITVTGKFSIYADENIRNIVKDAILNALTSEIQNTDNIIKESIEGYSVQYAQSDTVASLNRIKYLFPNIL